MRKLLCLIAIIFFNCNSQASESDSIKKTVTVRAPKSHLGDYYRYLSHNPTIINPIQAFEIQFQNITVPENYFQKASKINSLSDAIERNKQKQELLSQVYQLPVSFERHHLIEILTKETSEPSEMIMASFVESLESEIRKLRSRPGGEDLVLFINHNKWEGDQIKTLTKNGTATWTILSSAWSPCSFTGTPEKALIWLTKEIQCENWIQGNPDHYKWSKLSFLYSFRREVFWSSKQVKSDNWFNPQQIVSHDVSLHENKKSWKKWVTVAALLGSLHFLYQNRNKEVIIQFE
jgi:hypothetical protein